MLGGVSASRVLVGLPAPPSEIEDATHVRGTMIASSLRAMRARELEEAYHAALHPDFRDAIEHLEAQSWVPMPVGIAHYAAMDAIITVAAEQVRIGEEVGSRVHGAFLQTIVKSVRAVAGDVVPLAATKLPIVFDRLIRGGATRVVQLGDDELSIELHGLPLARFAYVTNGMLGLLRVAFGLVAGQVDLWSCEQPYGEHCVAYRLRWDV